MQTTAKNERIDIRATPEAKRVLRDAASARSKSVSEFVLDAALREARSVLAERDRFVLPGGQWERFLEALDAPARSPCS